MAISPSDVVRSRRYALVSAGHHFLLNVLPFGGPDSHAALATFVATIERIHSSPADLDCVLLRCLAVLDTASGPRVPTAVERYLLPEVSAVGSARRFSACVEELLRHTRISDGLVQEAVEYIRTNFADSTLHAREVATAIGARLSTLDVAFSRQVHCTVTEYIREVRLERATLLLATTSNSIKEVWTAIGYNHHSNFDHDFKIRFGVTPRTFRERSVRPLARSTFAAARNEVQLDRDSTDESHGDILIVDDDEATGAIIGRFLRDAGHIVHVANNGEEGLLVANNANVHTILLDYHLDDMDGIAFLRTLRASRSSEEPHVAVLTADWDILCHEDEIHSLGAIVVSKLCDINEVERLVTYLGAAAPSQVPSSGHR